MTKATLIIENVNDANKADLIKWLSGIVADYHNASVESERLKKRGVAILQDAEFKVIFEFQ